MTHYIHPETSIGYVYLKVRELKRSLAFYQEVIGLKILQQGLNKIYLSANGKDPLVVLEEDSNAIQKPSQTTGLYHFAILLPTRKDLGLFLQHLVKTQYPINGASDHLFSEAIYLSDPDQNGVEIYADRPRGVWQLDENGHIPFVSDPIDVKGLLSEAQGKQWNGAPTDTVMGHIHLHVANLEESEQFYSTILGFDKKVGPKDKQKVQAQFVSAGGYHHHIGFNLWAGTESPPQNVTGMVYFSIQLPNKHELQLLINALRENHIHMDVQNEGIFIKDPAGIEILLSYKK